MDLNVRYTGMLTFYSDKRVPNSYG